ncbi:hypothetical protein EJB05_57139, partial [Eragrostis curvula]
MVVAAALHGDILAGILRRLPARSLAASRRVCKAWRAVVDEQQLLLHLRRLLPHSVRGFFVNYVDHYRPHFFARPAAPAAAGTKINGEFNFLEPKPYGECMVVDHCNGLVLYLVDSLFIGELHACNPITKRSVKLPLPRVLRGREHRPILVFDPAVSRHYQVFLAPLHPETVQPSDESMEWPPSEWTWHVFSSRTGRWRERVFVREGEAAGTVADLLMDSLGYSAEPRWRFSAYWKGALYVHCHGEYVTRMSLSNAKYRVIESPIDRTECYNGVKSFLGRSQKGVYYLPVPTPILGPDDWWGFVQDYEEIKHAGPWILDDYEKRKTRDDVEWSSDDDDVIQAGDWNENTNDDDMYPDTFHVLGLHPYKEVIFLTTLSVAVAYHLNSSKVQFLGILNPDYHNCGVCDSFVYTPCARLA